MTRKSLLVALLVVAVAASAGAVDIVLKDGTVIHAKAYNVSGNYVVVTQENGSKVAYDRGDVDLAAMRQGQAGETAAPAAEKPVTTRGMVSQAVAQKPAKGAAKPAFTITDRDVAHVGGTGEIAPETEEGTDQGSLAGHQEGGLVVLQGVRVDPGDKKGEWKAHGEVINRKSVPVSDVRVAVEAVGTGNQTIGKAEVAIGNLQPGGKGVFSHTFTSPTMPVLRVRTFWMQVEAKAPTASGAQAQQPAGTGATAAPAGNTRRSEAPVVGSRPKSLQWGGAPAYKRGGASPAATPIPR